VAGPISETPSGGSKPFKKRVPMFSMPRGLATKKDIATVVGSLDRPVNAVMGLEGVQLSLAELSAIGVRGISVGSALYRTALGAALRVAREMRGQGTFTFAKEAASPRELSRIFAAIG
jgi:2-methylisocitrate lyase-like PEP mutase family enzyme